MYSFFQVFHKIITTGHQRLQPLFDCLLTIIVNGKNGRILKFYLHFWRIFHLSKEERNAYPFKKSKTVIYDSQMSKLH